MFRVLGWVVGCALAGSALAVVDDDRSTCSERVHGKVQALASAGINLQAQSLPVLTEEEIEALFSRLSPTATHYSKFLKAMEAARRRLCANLFVKFRERIVQALQQLEANVPPKEVRGFYPAERGVWEQRPLGTSTTDRFFVGQVGSRFFILALSYNVKSGIEKEHKLISGLVHEVRAFERIWNAAQD